MEISETLFKYHALLFVLVIIFLTEQILFAANFHFADKHDAILFQNLLQLSSKTSILYFI